MSVAYTEEDIAYIIANYKTVPYKDIATHLECSLGGLKKKMDQLRSQGLIKLEYATRKLPIGSQRSKTGKGGVKYMKILMADGKWKTLYRITAEENKGTSQTLLTRPFTPETMAEQQKRTRAGKHIPLQPKPKQMETLKKDSANYKMVRVDIRTEIEVHISKSDEDAINEWTKRREQSLADRGR